MTTTLRQLVLLVGKDLRIESRSRQTLGLVIVLGILIVTVLALGLGPQRMAADTGATAILWVAYLFGGVLCFEKTMSVERHDGALAGLLLAPVDRGVIYVSKLVTNLIMMIALALVVTPVGVVLFGVDLSPAPGGFFLIMLISFVGFAAVGTLFAAAVSSGQLQDGVLAMVIFPISLPVVITSTQMVLALFRDGQMSPTGLSVLVCFDVIYLVVGWMAFELLLEP